MELIDANKLRNALFRMREEKRITPEAYDELAELASDIDEEISERATPRNPEHFGAQFDTLCPTCSHMLTDDDGEIVNFCPNCGQRIQV